MIRNSVLPSTVENVGDGQSPVPTTPKLPLSPHRYTHAKNDPAHCTVPGLFQALQKGARNGKNHTVTHQYGDVALVFRCFEPLGADDLRVLQGLLAIGSPISEPVVLTAETSNDELREIRKNLQLSESCLHLETLVVQGSCYQLGKEIGLRGRGTDTFQRIRASIERLCGVSIIAKYKDGREHGYHLIGGYSSSERKKEIHVVLNPRLTAAVLGKRIDASGGYTRIEMDEVRRIKGDATRILHTYLCAIVSPGETRELLASTMRAHIWLQKPEPKQNKAARTKWLERVKKQHQRIRQAMGELNGIGWRCTQITDSRSNSKQAHYIKWEVSRPAILDAEKISDISEITLGAMPQTVAPEFSVSPTHVIRPTASASNQENPDISEIVIKSPAKALREFGDQLTDEQFSIAAAKQPVAAIKHHLDRLSDEKFSTAAARAPDAAIRYALHRLTDEQFSTAAAKEPSAAIQFALTRLTPEQFVAAANASTWPLGNPEVSETQLDAWFSCNPDTAANHLEAIVGKKLPTLQSLIPHLSPARLEACARAWPQPAFNNAQSIPAELLTDIARENPAIAIQFASKAIAHEIMDECILAAPAAAITHRFDALDPEQRSWCIKKSPWTAYTIHFRSLTETERRACRAAIKAAVPAKIDVMIRECPTAALEHAREYLTPQQLQQCSKGRQ